ncbi:MAG: hypothetical protein LBN43_06915 [Oscillospiraceae bacterium]|jgi:RNA polymerase sigma-70 factor (ECF subfamily)|nr:hypothetical protein [Oscillospiraceae bacterium]
MYKRKERDALAEEYHDLIYSFLRQKHLNEAEYYDVAALGFLEAVDDYLLKPELRREYDFREIAYKRMKNSLYKNLVHNGRPKRRGCSVSLNAPAYADNERITRQDMVSVPDSVMLDFQTELLLQELAERLSPGVMEVILMKINGYRNKDIAREKKMTVKAVTDLLNGNRDIVLAVCYG